MESHGTAPARSAAGVILASAVLAGLALGMTYVLAERFIRDELAGAFAVPCATASVLAVASLAALRHRGDRMTPLRMIGAWAVVVPVVAAMTTVLLSLVSERPEYIAHAAVQSAARSMIAVVCATLVLSCAWLRRWRAARARR